MGFRLVVSFHGFYVIMLPLYKFSVLYTVCFTVINYSFPISDLSGFGLVNITFCLVRILRVTAGLLF